MRRTFCKVLISVVGIAVVTSVAGCGGNDAPGAPAASSVAAPSPSGPPVDPNVAYEQYAKAAKPFECTPAYGAMGDAHHAGDFGAMKENAGTYRDVVAAFDAQLGRIAFPAAAQPIVGRMRELLAADLTGLNELVEVDVEDADRVTMVRTQVEFDDSSVVVEGDRLRAALGHPEPQAGYAADLLESADRTFYQDNMPTHAKWKAALAAGDLNGAKAANAIEEEAAQRYIDRLGTIPFPAGFEDEVNVLRDKLRGIIEFDRRQVDVATAAQIVPPEEGAPVMSAVEGARETLWVALVSLYRASDPESKC